MKTGANKVDQAKIVRLLAGDKEKGEAPKSAKEVSSLLRIKLSVVESFGKPKAKAK